MNLFVFFLWISWKWFWFDDLNLNELYLDFSRFITWDLLYKNQDLVSSMFLFSIYYPNELWLVSLLYFFLSCTKEKIFLNESWFFVTTILFMIHNELRNFICLTIVYLIMQKVVMKILKFWYHDLTILCMRF